MPDIELTSAELERLLCGDEVNSGFVRDLCFTVWSLCHNPPHEDGNTDWGNDTLPTVQEGVKRIRDHIRSLARAGLEAGKAEEWLPIETAPKDGTPIVGWCVHEANSYFDTETGKLTAYGCHVEGLGRVDDGAHILVWGGGDWDVDDSGKSYDWPDWWFRSGSEFEQAANPTHWRPLPAPPAIRALPLTGDET